ncbi:MAG: class I SAM-dependent methyltransferase [Capsulimonadaceae bacterium]
MTEGYSLVRRVYRKVFPVKPTVSSPLHINAADIEQLSSYPVITDDDLIRFHNPPAEIQKHYVGISYMAAYDEAAQFLNFIVEKAIPKNPQPAPDQTRVLDFGCGWGRMLRLLRHKPELKNLELYGCDPVRTVLDLCRRSLPDVWLTRCQEFPPSAYRDSMFDVVYAYSVFSHLNRDSHLAWAQEIARITRPGGYVCLTTESRKFIVACREMREGLRPVENDRHTCMLKAFVDPATEAIYDSGEMVFAASFGDTNPFGEAAVPKAFFEKHWGRFGFRLVDWGTGVNGQNRALLRKV